jgi:hypothetical protein
MRERSRVKCFIVYVSHEPAIATLDVSDGLMRIGRAIRCISEVTRL